MITTQEETIVVGLAEMQISKDATEVLTCLGLGSCIGVAAYDHRAKIGGMVHIVLPQSSKESDAESPKFADTAIPLLIREMQKLGAMHSRITMKIAGGALMSMSIGVGSLFKTGERNIEAVKQSFAESELRLEASAIGGNKGRTLKLRIRDGQVTVSSAGAETVDL